VNNAPYLVTATVERGMDELVDDRADVVDPPAKRSSRRRDWRWWVGGTGRILIAVGLLLLGFVAYQLWGTGIEHARAQSDLEKQFDDQLATTVAPATTVATTAAPATTVSPATTIGAATTVPATTTPPAPTRPEFADGDPVARLEIPRMGLDEIVVSGVGVDDLKKGPGHYSQTPLPGEHGNAAIAGHRTTYGAPFLDIDNLKPGDQVVATTYAGRFVYTVTGSTIVPPSEISVLDDTPDDRITLTSCDPKYSATNRIIVTAAFDEADSSPLVGATPATTAPVTTAPPDTSPDGPVVSAAVPTTVAATTAPPTTVAPSGGLSTDEAFQRGWFDDAAAWPQVIGWGLAGAAVVAGGWWLSRRSHWWVGAAAAALPFVVLLYFFYENVNRLLPPNI
jgi:sortase A